MSNDRQPLSPKFYFLVWAGGTVVLILVFSLLVTYGDVISSVGLTDNAWFGITIFLGSTSAAFFFGAMRSFARVRGKTSGSAIELGGPAALGALVLYFGMQVGPGEDTVTVRLTTVDGTRPSKLDGSLILHTDLGPYSGEIASGGYVYFPGIPQRFFGTQVDVELSTNSGYQILSDDSKFVLKRESIQLRITKIFVPPKIEQRHYRIWGNQLVDFFQGDDMIHNLLGNPAIKSDDEIYREAQRRLSEDYLFNQIRGRDISSVIFLMLENSSGTSIDQLRLVDSSGNGMLIVRRFPVEARVLVLVKISGIDPGESRERSYVVLEGISGDQQFSGKVSKIPSSDGFIQLKANLTVSMGAPPK